VYEVALEKFPNSMLVKMAFILLSKGFCGWREGKGEEKGEEKGRERRERERDIARDRKSEYRESIEETR